MIMSHHPTSGQNQNTRTANELFENVAQIRNLGTTLKNLIDIHDEIKTVLNSGSYFYHSVQNRLSYPRISKNLKIKIHRTLIFPVLLFGCEIWSLTLREENRVF
jgi:hypothetical protein